MSRTIDGGATLQVLVGGQDVTARVLDLSWDRGKPAVWAHPSTGTCSLRVDNTDGTYTHGSGLAVGDLLVVTLSHTGTSRTMFTGRVYARREQVDTPKTTSLLLEAADWLEQLSRYNRLQPNGEDNAPTERPDQRIGRWLDLVGYSGTRDLATATGWTVAEKALEGNALAEIRAAAAVEGGEVWCEGDGALTYRLWDWRKDTRSSVVQAVIGDRDIQDWVVLSSAEYVTDLDTVANRVQGRRRPISDVDAPVTQSVGDNASQLVWGIRDYPPLDNLEALNDTMVATRVGNVLDAFKQPFPHWDTVTVRPAPHGARSWVRLIPLRMHDLVQVSVDNLAGLGLIMGERWVIGPSGSQVTYRLEPVGVWEVQRPPTGPLVIDTSTGCWRVPPGYVCDDVSSVVWKDANGNVLRTDSPGALCGVGACDPPVGAVTVCLTNAHGETCFTPDLDASDAIFWLSGVVATNDMLERITGQRVDGLAAGFGGVQADTFGSGVPGIQGLEDGTGIAADVVSDVVAAADLSGGWTFSAWLSLEGNLPAGTVLEWCDWGRVRIELVGVPLTVGSETWLRVNVYSGGAFHGASVAQVPTGAHLWRIEWQADTSTLRTTMDAVEV